jgi:hypothetical protein
VIAAGPSSVPAAVTEVVCETPDKASEMMPEVVSQNDPKIGLDRAPAGHPGVGRSYHQQMAERPMARVMPGLTGELSG